MTEIPRFIRSAVLNDYVETARAVGLDPYRMVSEFGLPSASLTDPELKIPAAAVAALLEESAARSQKADFGLRLAQQRTISNVGALALLVREQRTMRQAILVLVEYLFLHSDALRLELRERSGEATLSLAVDTGRPLLSRQGVELGIGFLHRSFERLFGESWKPAVVCFTHSSPGRRGGHSRYFGTEVLFDQDFNGIFCASSDLDTAMPAADAAMACQAQKYLEALSANRSPSMSVRVRECVYGMLASGRCSADSVASCLGVDRRTVHRHLLREGQTFSAIMESVRSELVIGYIGNHSRPLASVADLLGFSALSAFSRWFKQQFGCTVSEWRAAHVKDLSMAPAQQPPASVRDAV